MFHIPNLFKSICWSEWTCFFRFVQQTLRYVFAADVVRRGREEGLLLDLESGQEMLAKAQAQKNNGRFGGHPYTPACLPFPSWPSGAFAVKSLGLQN